MMEFMGSMMSGMKPEEREKMMSGMIGMMKGMQEAMEKGFKPWETFARMEEYLKDIAQTNREILEELKKK
jgi:hypothetical protein